MSNPTDASQAKESDQRSSWCWGQWPDFCADYNAITHPCIAHPVFGPGNLYDNGTGSDMRHSTLIHMRSSGGQHLDQALAIRQSIFQAMLPLVDISGSHILGSSLGTKWQPTGLGSIAIEAVSQSCVVGARVAGLASIQVGTHAISHVICQCRPLRSKVGAVVELGAVELQTGESNDSERKKDNRYHHFNQRSSTLKRFHLVMSQAHTSDLRNDWSGYLIHGSAHRGRTVINRRSGWC